MFEKPSRKIYRVFMHCSASDHTHHDNIETIRSWHLERGFSDVGYHYFIRKNGTLEQRRDLAKTSAAQKGHTSWNHSHMSTWFERRELHKRTVRYPLYTL